MIMKKILTLELDQQNEILELHINKLGAEYLINLLSQLEKNNVDCDKHLLTSYWGGKELSSEKQNLKEEIQLLNHLKIMYWDSENKNTHP